MNRNRHTTAQFLTVAIKEVRPLFHNLKLKNFGDKQHDEILSSKAFGGKDHDNVT